MRVSIEIPAFKGEWLSQCVESVFAQTSPDWELSIIWDGGDELARAIVEELALLGEPRLRTYFGDRRGIAHARRFLTERSSAEWILPVDDDDLLARDAVQSFLDVARAHPWAGIVRARRVFIDEASALVPMDEWFPFEPRHYQRGMVKDLYNHCQPYLIRRSAYERTEGWSGFQDYSNAGEDCDIFTKIEEVAPIILHDQVLYYYRLHGQRASHTLGPDGAREMWRRIADRTIERLGLPLLRCSELQPFEYELKPVLEAAPDAIHFVIAGAGDAEQTRRCLLEQGVSDYAIRIVEGAPAAARNCGYALSQEPFIGFIDAGVSLAPGAVKQMIQRLGKAAVDLVVYATQEGRPSSLILIRREVFRACGGFDESFNSSDLVTADFLFKALRRDFICITTSDWVDSGIQLFNPDADELAMFLRMWPNLVEVAERLIVKQPVGLLA
jgi:glycosyltransferase involved in cell wall biosynthesis